MKRVVWHCLSMSTGSANFKIREDGLGWETTEPKTVGKSKRLSPAEVLRWNQSMLRLSPLCGKWFPRGIFKFKSWKEESEWTKTQLAAASSRPK